MNLHPLQKPRLLPLTITNYIPSRRLRSVSEQRLVVPSQRGTKSLSRTFSFTVPGWWNDLHIAIRNAESLTIFKRLIQTHLFHHHLTSYKKQQLCFSLVNPQSILNLFEQCLKLGITSISCFYLPL